jgi:hypothetical protein
MDNIFFDIYPKMVHANSITSFKVTALYEHSRKKLQNALQGIGNK